jgi:hypothetical protein
MAYAKKRRTSHWRACNGEPAEAATSVPGSLLPHMQVLHGCWARLTLSQGLRAGVPKQASSLGPASPSASSSHNEAQGPFSRGASLAMHRRPLAGSYAEHSGRPMRSWRKHHSTQI